MTCPACYGFGYQEHPAYYYGRAECSTCLGTGDCTADLEPHASDCAIWAAERCDCVTGKRAL
jgi:hypothetical protein